MSNYDDDYSPEYDPEAREAGGYHDDAFDGEDDF